MHLKQLKWVQPSQQVIIKIGAPNLKVVEKGTHKTLRITNVNNDYLKLIALVGKVIVEGKTKQFNIDVENGKVDASKLIAENAKVTIWGSGKAKVYVENEIYSTLKNNARLELVNIPKKIRGDRKKSLTKIKNESYSELKWINFKIKNNSWNRNNFVVIGPKKDGSKFSYGFPMMPGKIKKERWSIGTKVYKVNRAGMKKLLITIKPENKSQTIKLFKNKKPLN